MNHLGTALNDSGCVSLSSEKSSQLLVTLAQVRELIAECIESPSNCKEALLCHQIREVSLPLCQLSLVRVVEVLNSSVTSVGGDINARVDNGMTASPLRLKAYAEVVDDVVCYIESLRDGYQSDDAFLENMTAKISRTGAPLKYHEMPRLEGFSTVVMGGFLDDAGHSLQSIRDVFMQWREAPAHIPYAMEFLRQLHALKGGVLVCGVEVLVADIQYLESCTAAFLKKELKGCDTLFELLGRYVNRLGEVVDLLCMQHVENSPLPVGCNMPLSVPASELPGLPGVAGSRGKQVSMAEGVRRQQEKRQPFSQRVPRLHFLVERASAMLGKPVQLVVQGEELAFSREVMEKLIAPLELLLWNAIDHGIESREIRAAAGKPERGEIVLSLALNEQDSTVLLKVADDGAGIDEAAVQRQALQAGCVASAEEAAQADLAEMIFYPGLSTAAVISPVSGRGMGLDVVNTEVGRLGGQVQVETLRGQGACFILSVPVSKGLSNNL